PRPKPIPETGTEQQTFVNILVFTDEDFVATSDPDPAIADDLSVIYNSNEARAAEPAAIETAYGAALRIENPARHDPDTIGCVSCHVATGARSWIERNRPWDGAEHPDRYSSERNLALTSEVAGKTTSLRAFGHLGFSSAISQRTVNETAAVLDRLAE